MNDRPGQDTLVSPAPQESELVMLAGLAFASRHVNLQQTVGPRNLVFLSPDALDMDLSDPAQRDFGDYELLEKIGRGGMGLVYRAHQRSLDREVALKLLIAGPWAPPRFIERFRAEAQSAARLEHPNIVTVYESGSQHDLHYFSMRLVRGESLATKLSRDGVVAPREAARMLRVVADAVDYAHRLGVLHLDLKPGNVLVDETGEPLVADFGLARRIDEALADQGGEASGTPSYMAPEQADWQSQRIGRATDIYGLGSILYEMLCGRPPFAAATPQATLAQVLEGQVQPPRAYNTGIPRALEAICLKCLRKDPAERYATAAELAEDLRNFLADRPVSAWRSPLSEQTMRWIRREPRLAAAVAGVALALVVGLAATSHQWQRAEGNAQAARQLLWEGRREAALRLEQDGQGYEAMARLLANVKEQEQAGELEQAAVERLRIGLMRGQGARLIDTALVADANPMAAALSPDGAMLALSFNDLTVRWYDSQSLEELGRVSVDGLPTSGGERRAPMLLRFTPERMLLVTLEWYGHYVSPAEGDSWLVDLERRELVAPPEEFDAYSDAAFSADGRWALLRDRAGRVQLWQTRPWQAHSPLLDDDTEALVWGLARDGRYAFALGEAMRTLRVHDLSGTAPPFVLNLPGNSGISAWMQSADGRHLALGDFEGRVFLFELETRRLRQLPALSGREVVWLAFSEDDRWLAVANFDGLAQVLDVAGGDLVASGEMRAEFAVQQVGISRAQRLLVIAGSGELALWRVPVEGPRVRPGHRIGLPPAPQASLGRYPVGWSLDQGLLATAGMDGEIRLWRLPTSPMLPVDVPRQIADRSYYDHQRVVDVHWNQLRLVSPQGRPLTRWIELAQPPGFAVLLDSGRTLVATIGPELHAFDTRRLAAKYPPIPLPSTPQRMLPSADGRFVLLSFGGHGPRGHEEHLRLVDAREGRWLPGEATVAGPIRRFLHSPDWRRVAAVGPADGETTVLERDGLRLVAEFPHDPFEPVVWADFHGDRLWLVTRADDTRYGRDGLLLWDPERDRVEFRHDSGNAAPQAVIATPRGAVVAGSQRDFHLRFDGNTDSLPRLFTFEPTFTMTMSRNGRILARGHRYGMQLIDLASSQPVGPPLWADINALDWLVDFGFTADGRGLQGRSILSRHLHWTLEPEASEVEVLEAELERLLRTREGPPVLHQHSAAERRGLRSADPGAWPPPEEPPALPSDDGTSAALNIPARSAAAPPLALDLSPYYTHDPFELRNTFWNVTPTLRGWPAGLQNLAGVEFDTRGLVDIGARAGTLAEPGDRMRLDCVPMPEEPAAAVHLYGQVGLPSPVATGTPLATLTLHYRDGGPVSLPLRAGREFPGFAGDDHAVPLKFAPHHTLRLAVGDYDVVSMPRLANPYPQRIPRCLDLEVHPPFGPLALHGITIEPVGEDAGAVAAAEPQTPPGHEAGPTVDGAEYVLDVPEVAPTRVARTAGHPPVLRLPSPAERQGLRSTDPGPWPTPERPAPVPSYSGAGPALNIPARSADTPPLALDLGPYYTWDAFEIRNTFWNVMPTLVRFPAGLQRIAGVDFDIRGVVEIGIGRVAGVNSKTRNRLECVAMPEVATAAINLFGQLALPSPVATGTILGELTLHYQDGGRESISMRAGREFPGFSDDDQAVPLKFAPDQTLRLAGGTHDSFSVPRLSNPHPERLPRCLDLEVYPPFGPLALLAITVEPVGQAPGVIATAEIRTTVTRGTSPQSDGPEERRSGAER
jgi:hypothetical protein